MDTYNHLMVDALPIVPTDMIRLKMIDLWKESVMSIDIEEHNKHSQRQVSDELDCFFDLYPYVPEQRDVDVFASLLNWLPSNCGIAFLIDAETYSDIFNSKTKGYASAWAIENRRQLGSNGGNTLLEHLLTPPLYHDFHRGVICPANEFVSVRDVECSQYFIDFLATHTFTDIMKKAVEFFPRFSEVLNKREK